MSQNIARAPGAAEVAGAKATLRQTLLAARRNQPLDAARERRLARHVLMHLARLEPACVGFYWAVAGEFDASPVLVEWLAGRTERRAALPVVRVPHAPLAFHRWEPHAKLVAGRYGILVPEASLEERPDLLLIPCVGFDKARYRLGYGGGYYDRTLSQAADTRPKTLGVAYESARVATLPRGALDIPLDAIVTERGIF